MKTVFSLHMTGSSLHVQYNQNVLMFFSHPPLPAFALGMEGLIPEAICKMENLRSKHDVELGVAMALLFFHGKAKIVDR